MLTVFAAPVVFDREVVHQFAGLGNGDDLGLVVARGEQTFQELYLTGEAKEGAVAFGSTDNRKTYNQTSSVNLSGNNFYVRDEQDIRSLAVEIATLTRRQQRGKGLRMA